MNIVGPNIRRIRESKKLTQDELAAHCNLAGFNISRSTLAKIEVKARRVTDIELQLFSKALNVKIQDLFAKL